MDIIIRQAKIIDAESTFHNKTVDILILDGIIHKIAPSVSGINVSREIVLENLHISRGWFDSSVSFGEPGFEERESLTNGLEVAAKSGFTGLAIQPNSFPVIDNQSQIKFIKSKANGHSSEVFPIGALTKGSEGKDLAELFDMKNSGAIAFGDYNKSISNANLMKIALQYVQDFDGLVIAFAQDSQIKGNGVANEGEAATRLGLKGIPSLAEELQLARNLSLLEYTGGKLHVPTISTAKSVQHIKEAKSKGLKVTCSVAVHNLVFSDEKLAEFDTRFKVSPPLRAEFDRQALVKAVLDNTIDMITTDHNPIDIEHKKMEFDYAKDGTIGLESAFGALLNILPLGTVIEKMTSGRTAFGIETNPIAEGIKANLCLFRPDTKTIFTEQNILSKSKNSAFLGLELTGKVYGTYNQAQLVLA